MFKGQASITELDRGGAATAQICFRMSAITSLDSPACNVSLSGSDTYNCSRVHVLRPFRNLFAVPKNSWPRDLYPKLFSFGPAMLQERSCLL